MHVIHKQQQSITITLEDKLTLNYKNYFDWYQGADLRGGCRGCAPPEMTCLLLPIRN